MVKVAPAEATLTGPQLTVAEVPDQEVWQAPLPEAALTTEAVTVGVME